MGLRAATKEIGGMTYQTQRVTITVALPGGPDGHCVFDR